MKYLALTLPGGETVNPPAGLPQGGLNTTSSAIGNAVTIMLILVVILALIFFIWGGIMWVTSGGDKQKVTAARSRLTYAIVGLVIAFLAFFIVNVIGYVFKVNLIGVG